MTDRTTNTKKNKIIYFERVEPMFGSGRRDWSVDVLRCLSCFMVCAIHSTRMTIGFEHPGTYENIWLHNEIYSTLCAAPTVLFVMVSGIFFLSPERKIEIGRVWTKNICKMASAYIFWCLIFAIYHIWTMEPRPVITTNLLIEQWLIEPSHLWYIPMIIGLYMICPIIRPITASGDTKLFKYIVVVFIGGLVLWTIYNWPAFQTENTYIKDLIDRTPMELICQYPFWMIIGWIAYSYRPDRKTFIGICILGALAIGIGIYSNIYTWNDSMELEYKAMTQKFGIVPFFKNIAIFFFITNVFRNHEFSDLSKKVLRKWSDYTLIIYLVHFLILEIMYDNNFLYSAGMSPWIGVWIYAIIAYLGGGLLALIFHVIWDPIKRKLFHKNKNSKKSKRQRRKERKRAREARKSIISADNLE